MLRCTLLIALILFAGCSPSAEQQAADVFTEALLYHEEGDLEKAIACYGLALELEPRTGEGESASFSRMGAS